jgi:hypothetical protein
MKQREEHMSAHSPKLSLDELRDAIRAYIHLGDRYAVDMYQQRWRVGRLLLEAKPKLPHGQFQKWIETNFKTVSYKQMTLWMRFAATFKQPSAGADSDSEIALQAATLDTVDSKGYPGNLSSTPPRQKQKVGARASRPIITAAERDADAREKQRAQEQAKILNTFAQGRRHGSPLAVDIAISDLRRGIEDLSAADYVAEIEKDLKPDEKRSRFTTALLEIHAWIEAVMKAIER